MEALTAWLIATGLSGAAGAAVCGHHVRRVRARVKRIYETTELPNQGAERGEKLFEMLEAGAKAYENGAIFFIGRILGWTAVTVSVAGLVVRTLARLGQ